MHLKNLILTSCFIAISFFSFAQETAIYTHDLKDYNHAKELYQDRSFLASQQLFTQIKHVFDNSSENKANCEYYIANCAIRLGQQGADDLMLNFVEKYPTSTKRNNAFLETADYYFKAGKYAYALKWYGKADTYNLSLKQKEDYNFTYGYSLFASKNYEESKKYFVQLLDSQEYGSRAKYYYGYIAYQDDDYETAEKNLGEVITDDTYKSDVSYYLSEMNFKLGKFEKAIELGESLLPNASKVEHSEISKIVGESYFNLKKYAQSIPHLSNYKGSRGKWTNTDYYLLGYAHYKQNDYKNAIASFNKIINGNNPVAQNAYYHLAECYLKLDKKPEALNAFRNASQMEYEPQLQEDATLNYAKLSYEIGNPYKNVSEVLQDYLDKYPKSSHKKEINDLIISAYMTSQDYQGALEFLEKKKDPKSQSLFQKAAFYRGVQVFNEDDYPNALNNFEKSLSQPIDENIIARARYWKGESNFRTNNFNDALSDFTKFLNSPEAQNTQEYTTINYNIAYTYFKQKEYQKASSEFQKYISQNKSDEDKLNDALLRLGDTYFVTSNYQNAIKTYDKIVQKNAPRSDYAQFQKAISYGYVRQDSQKIEELNSFLNKFPKSTYKDDAYYILANEYVEAGENQKALEKYDFLITNFKRSPFVSKAMLKKGVVYYNTDKNEQALSTYKIIVSRFPNTAEAKQAVASARQIYVDLGRVDEYAEWVSRIDFVNVTDADLDNDMYESAEKQYLQNESKKAISGFKKYLEKFPRGLHALKSNFYLAQSLYADNQKIETIPHYKYVVDQEQGEYTEQSLSRLSQAYLENDDWKNAIPILERLETESDDTQNITFAQSNLMKAYYTNQEYSNAVNYAEKVLRQSRIDNRIKSDAQVIIARSAIKTNNNSKARNAYKQVESIATGELKAEALYYSAYFEHQDGSYRVSNQIVQKIASDYAAYKYWGAKGLIIMAKNHYELKDSFQATYILESVIKNFSQYDDIAKDAQIELNKIKTEEAKTNNSVIPGN